MVCRHPSHNGNPQTFWKLQSANAPADEKTTSRKQRVPIVANKKLLFLISIEMD
jgi:hypothetical protein